MLFFFYSLKLLYTIKKHTTIVVFLSKKEHRKICFIHSIFFVYAMSPTIFCTTIIIKIAGFVFSGYQFSGRFIKVIIVFLLLHVCTYANAHFWVIAIWCYLVMEYNCSYCSLGYFYYDENHVGELIDCVFGGSFLGQI